MRTQMAAALPLELWLTVLVHVDDFVDLMRARLVCRQWRQYVTKWFYLWVRTQRPGAETAPFSFAELLFVREQVRGTVFSVPSTCTYCDTCSACRAQSSALMRCRLLSSTVEDDLASAQAPCDLRIAVGLLMSSAICKRVPKRRQLRCSAGCFPRLLEPPGVRYMHCAVFATQCRCYCKHAVALLVRAAWSHAPARCKYLREVVADVCLA